MTAASAAAIVASIARMAVTIFSVTPAGSNDAAGISFRAKCVTSGGAGNEVRVTFKAGSGGAFLCNHMSIGIHTGTAANTTAIPVELFIAGVAGCNISAGATATTDWAALTVTSGATVVVVMDNASPSKSSQVTPGGSNGRNYFSASATYNQATPGTGTGNDGVIDSVMTIEVR